MIDLVKKKSAAHIILNATPLLGFIKINFQYPT